MRYTLYHIYIYLITFMIYASFHALREGWSYSKVDISKQFNISKSYLGIVDGLYLVAYSLGMVILGSFMHKFTLKSYVLMGLCISCISYMLWMIVYSLTGFYSIVFMTIMMIVNGFFQATGWPGVMGIFGLWFAGAKKGFLVGIWSCSSSVGDIFASVLLNLLSDYNINFVWNFILTGGMGLIVALLVLLFLR